MTSNTSSKNKISSLNKMLNVGRGNECLNESLIKASVVKTKKIKLRKIHYILKHKLEPIADMINKPLLLKTTLKYSK